MAQTHETLRKAFTAQAREKMAKEWPLADADALNRLTFAYAGMLADDALRHPERVSVFDGEVIPPSTATELRGLGRSERWAA